MRRARFLVLLSCLAALAACDDGAHTSSAGEADGHAHEEATASDAEAHEGEGRALAFSPEDLEAFGVAFEAVGPGALDLGFEVPGEIQADPQRLSRVGARFPGVVVSVSGRVGDRVKAGDVLAVVESEHLSRFELRSGIPGTVLEQRAAPGEVLERDRAAFVVADLREVWAVLALYPQDLTRVAPGQPVHVRAPEGTEARATVDYVSPVADTHTRAGWARAVLDNEEGRWRPGLFVTATVLEPVEVALRVPNEALQTVDGRPVAFVRSQGRVEARPLALGRRGLAHTEVLAGLEAGDTVATSSVFLLKAELEKGEGGGHHH